MYDEPDHILEISRPRRPASAARLRAMARQLVAARGEAEHDVHDGFDLPRRMVLIGLARRSLPVGDQSKMLGMAQKEEESTS